MPSGVESCEEQDGSKQKFVGGTKTKLWLIFLQGVAKNTEKEWKWKIQTLLKKANFPASFDD